MFKGLQHLEWLDMSFTGDIWGLANCGQTLENITNLVTLNISNCRISNIPPEAFKNQKNLQYLDLQQNTISTLPTNIFQEQKYLQYLDLSFNNLHSLPGGIFITCNSTNLSIKLKGNHIGSLPEAMFSLLHTAVELDLCDNDFHHIDASTLTVIQNVSIINLSGNPFECDCELAHFVNWAKSHETQVVGWNNNFTDGFNVTNNDYYRCNGKSLENFDEYCHSSTAEYLVPSLVVIVVIVAFVVGYLLKKTVKRHRQGYQNIVGSDQEPLPITKHYKYDLYVIHSSEDLEWVQILTAKLEVEGHYKISYPDKDFVLGHTIFKNIDNFLEQSRTILGIISTNALNSPWCCYELERARTLEIEQRGDHKLIPILLEDGELLLKHMETKEYSYAIVHLIQNKTNLEWSEDGRLEPEYWKRLKKDIGKPVVLLEGQA
ncbi:toll-like receptor 4 [Branchiostoma floridae x Branchiostoma japonicum]